MILEQNNLNQILETAVTAARLAGQKAMREIDSARITIKNNSELVTQLDSQCQRLIIDHVQKTYPDDGFICEEGDNGKIFKQNPRGRDCCWWVIDPIDGTNNFAHRILIFTVSIGVMYKGEPIVGVIYDPATDSMFTAIKGRQAQLNGRPITAGDESLNKFASLTIDSYFDHGIPSWAEQLMMRTRFRDLGTTALHLAYLAKGSFIATVLQKPKLWDVAAGAVIAESAGAVVTDWDGKKIFPYDIEAYNGQSLQILAANKTVHPEILQLLK